MYVREPWDVEAVARHVDVHLARATIEVAHFV